MSRFLRGQPAQPKLGKPLYLSPLARVTTPGQLRIRTALVAARTSRDWRRDFPLQGFSGAITRQSGDQANKTLGAHNPLLGPRPPMIVKSPPTVRQQKIITAQVAVRTSREWSRNFPLQGFTGRVTRQSGEQANRPLGAHNPLLGPRPPQIVTSPPTQRQQTILGGSLSNLYAVRRRVERQRREFPDSVLEPPRVVTAASTFVASPIDVSLAARAPGRVPQRRTVSSLGGPVVVAPPPLAPPITIAFPLRRQRPRHEPTSVLRPPTVTASTFVAAPVNVVIPLRRQRGRRDLLPSFVRPPTTLQVFAGPSVDLATGRTRTEDNRRRGRSLLSKSFYLSPLVSVVTPARLRVTLAGRTRTEDDRRRVEHVLGRPYYLSPLAVVTTPGQLSIKATLTAVRGRTPQRRTVSSLGGPAVVAAPPLAPPISVNVPSRRQRGRRDLLPSFVRPPATLAAAASVTTKIAVTLARSPRPSTRTRLSRPTALQTFAGPRVALTRQLPRRTVRYFLRPATVVQVPSVIQAEDTIRVALAPSSRATRAPHSRLTPPSTLQVFRGPQVTVVRARPRATRYFLRPAQVVQVPSVIQAEDTIKVVLAPSSRAARVPRSRLALPTALQIFRGPQITVVRARPRPTRYFLRPATVVQVPSVIQAEDTIRVILATRPLARRSSRALLSPPTVVRRETFSGPDVTLAAVRSRIDLQRRGTYYRLSPAKVVQVPSVIQAEDTIKVTLVAVRTVVEGPRHFARYRIFPPTVVQVPSVIQQEDTIRVTLAGQTRASAPRRASTAVVRPPTTLTIFGGPLVELAGRTRAELQRRASHYFLRPAQVVEVPSVIQQEDTVRVTFGGRAAIELRRRASHYFLRPATVVEVPSVLQQEDTIRVVSVAVRPLARRSGRAAILPPTVLQVFAGPAVTLAGRTRADLQRRAPVSHVFPPTILRVPFVLQQQQTIRVTLVAGRVRAELVRRTPRSEISPPTVVTTQRGDETISVTLVAVRTLVEQSRHAPHSKLGKPFYLSPLARITTAGHLRVRTTLVAVRTVVEQQRHFARYKLGKPLYLSPLARVTTPGQLSIRRALVAVRTRIEQPRHFARYQIFPEIVGQNPARPTDVTLAGRTRADAQRRAPHSFLGGPQALRVFAGPRVTLAGRNRDERIRREPRSVLSPPSVIRIPSVEQQRRTIRVELAPARRPVTASKLRAPRVVASPPPPRDEGLSTALVAVRGRLEGRREPRSILRRPTVVRVPPPPREEGVTSALVAVRTAALLARRPTSSRLAQNIVPRRTPVVAKIRTAFAPTPPTVLPRGPHSILRPPIVVTPAPTPSGFVGHGGSGMSDASYRRLLKRLGALPPDITDDELVDLVATLRLLGLL